MTLAALTLSALGACGGTQEEAQPWSASTEPSVAMARLAQEPWWEPTGSLAQSRLLHTATRLENGFVLVAGGYNTSAELYNPSTRTWKTTGSTLVSHRYHSMTLLKDGRVLIAGGEDCKSGTSAELYNPSTGTWSATTGGMVTCRANHTAVLLPSGHVLVMGGKDNSGKVLSSAELYDPATGTWSSTGDMDTVRTNHTATLMTSGDTVRVLVAGGSNGSGSLTSAEVYDPATRTWTSVGSMSTPRRDHTATGLSGGKVLVAGGGGSDRLLAARAELYDPVTQTWTDTGAMSKPRRQHTATLLQGGQVLVAGGYHESTGISFSSELYDPTAGTWRVTAGMNVNRQQHTATLLSDGAVLVVGGFSSYDQGSAELFLDAMVPESCHTDILSAKATCAGPQEYQLQCFNKGRAEFCGVEKEEKTFCYPSCVHPDFGLQERKTEEVSVWVKPLVTKREDCDYTRKPPCRTEYIYNYTTPCKAAAEAKKNEIDSRYRDAVTVTYAIDWSTAEDGNTDNPSGARCDITLYNYPVYKQGTGPQCGELMECGVTRTYKECRHSSFDVDSENTCGFGLVYSSPGLTPDKARVEAQSAWAAQGNVETLESLGDAAFVKPPTCLSCDDKGVSATADASTRQAQLQAKFSCLNDNYARLPGMPDASAPSGVNRAALEAQLVGGMKMLFELEGGLLSSATQQRAMDLYLERPAITSSCGSPWVAPSVTDACPPPSVLPGLNATLAMCDQLLEEHVSPGASRAALDRCTSTAFTIASLSATDCGGTTYRGEYDRLNVGLLLRTLPDMSTTLGTEARVSELSAKLSTIQQWYGQSRSNLYRAATPDPKLLASSSQVMKAFWTAAYLGDEFSLSPTTNADAEVARQKVLNDGLTTDLQVMRAAFGASGPPPLTGAPLLYLVSDVLHGLEERLTEVSRLHDMGCRFKSCNTTPTATSQTWSLLASLHDPDALDAKLTEASLINTDWAGAFRLMQYEHSAFQSATQDAFGLAAYAPDVFTRPLDSIPAPARSLAAMMGNARARTHGYQTDGLFLISDAKRLEVGLDNARQDQILTHLNGTLSTLSGSIATYDNNRLTYVQGLLEQLRNKGSQMNLLTHMTRLRDQFVQLDTDLNGLRATRAVDEARYGDFMKGLEALVPAMEDSGEDMLKTQYVLTVPGRGRMTGLPGDVSGMAVETTPGSGTAFKITARAGEQLVLQVNGAWAPSCAIGLTASPTGAMIRTSTFLGPITTGPEGYSVVDSSGTYSARENQTVSSNGVYLNSSASTQVCAGVGFSTPAEHIVQLSVKAENCLKGEAGATWSSTSSHSDATGSETRSTFTGGRGLRSPLAPFFSQPVGSLLLVRMDPAGTLREHIRSVQVVQAPNTSVLVPSDSAESVYYLVVNDRVDTRCSWVNDLSLNVRISHLEPTSEAAREVASAMAAAAQKVSERGAGYVAQGRLLPSQASQLRDEAYQELYTRCGCTDLSRYPESLRNLFDTFVDKALVDVEREVELVNIERQLRAVMLELRAVDDELKNAQSQSRLLALSPAWALRNLDGTKLRSDLQALEQVLGNWLAPVIALRHPETLSSFTASDRVLLDRLTGIDPFHNDIRELAMTARDAAQVVEQRLRAVRTAAPTPTLNDVILSIPNPNKTVTSVWKKVDGKTAQKVWEDIEAGRNPVLNLTPEFVYSATGGQKVLPCNYSVPVIRSMALYLAYATASAPPPIDIPVSLVPAMTFPTVSGKQGYDFINSYYLGPYVTVMMGSSLNAPAAMANYWDQPGHSVATGLSPFGSYHLELGVFAEKYPSTTPGKLDPSNPLAKADELLVGFRLEPRQEAAGAKLPGVPQCEAR